MMPRSGSEMTLKIFPFVWSQAQMCSLVITIPFLYIFKLI
jgi:hypothetical protein